MRANMRSLSTVGPIMLIRFKYPDNLINCIMCLHRITFIHPNNNCVHIYSCACCNTTVSVALQQREGSPYIPYIRAHLFISQRLLGVPLSCVDASVAQHVPNKLRTNNRSTGLQHVHVHRTIHLERAISHTSHTPHHIVSESLMHAINAWIYFDRKSGGACKSARAVDRCWCVAVGAQCGARKTVMSLLIWVLNCSARDPRCIWTSYAGCCH